MKVVEKLESLVARCGKDFAMLAIGLSIGTYAGYQIQKNISLKEIEREGQNKIVYQRRLDDAFAVTGIYEIRPGDNLFDVSLAVRKNCPKLKKVPWGMIRERIKVEKGKYVSSDNSLTAGRSLMLPSCYTQNLNN